MSHNSQQEYIDTLSKQVRLYDGCGNMLGIVPLTLTGYPEDEDFRQDARLREYLTNWGREIKSDSVMVLIGDPKNRGAQGYDVFMYVFEPNGDDGTGLGGGISVMCGNGIRAVAAYIRELNPTATKAEIMTLSGMKTVEWEGELYSVEMGELMYSREALAHYVNSKEVSAVDGEYYQSPVPTQLISRLAPFIDARSWSIGLNGEKNVKGDIDGEPHIVIEVPKEQAGDLKTLRQLAVEVGPTLTKALSFFPKQINVNFIVDLGLDKKDGKVHILNCTHERNLGDNPDHSVTATCATGSTVAAGTLLRRQYPEKLDQVVVVHNKGGDLEVTRDSRDPRRMIMKGPVGVC